MKAREKYIYKGEQNEYSPSKGALIEIDYLKGEWIHYKVIDGVAPNVKNLRFKTGSDFEKELVTYNPNAKEFLMDNALGIN